MIPRRRFFYLRHGETDWNAHGRAQGRSDIPLNGTGRAQAREAAARLAGRGVGRIVASPLARARETASIVAEALDLPIEIDVDLQEVDFGAREGDTMSGWYERWLAGEETPDGGESFEALVARGAAGLTRHLEATSATVLFVAHGALFRAIRRALGQTIHARLANGATMQCSPDGDGWTVALLPDGNMPAAAAPSV